MYSDKLKDELHPQKDTPHYYDGCEHPKESYIGSIQWINEGHNEEWLDVYVYDDIFVETAVCIRYGEEASEYYSVGSIINLIRFSGKGQMDRYDLALHLIRKKRLITAIARVDKN